MHHVHTIPIDYDGAMYAQARDVAGGTDERLFEDYFDAQFDMLQKLKPLVVGHFDLIRLKSEDPNGSFQRWPGVWAKIRRNLEFVASYGGILELNSAALRKGMSEPYPKAEICRVGPTSHYSPLATALTFWAFVQEFLAMNGRFCLSDDSHGVPQVGLNYHRVRDFIDQVGISTLHYLDLSTTEETGPDSRFPRTQMRAISVEEMRTLPFWS